jgi:L-threonate 2-dehydrogenase
VTPDAPARSRDAAAPAPTSAAVIGVGNMGLAIVGRLLELGVPTAVRDVLPAREALATALGARSAGSPADAARGATLAIVVVVDAAQTEAVLFGPGGLAEARSVPQAVLLCPTIAPEDTERFAAGLAARGIAAIDAPMSGGPARAREGRMSLLVAGEAALVARHRALLDRLADPVFHVGERPGDGARTKLVNNLLAAVHLAAAAEALALAERAGLDAARTLDVIERSSGASWIANDRGRRWLAARAAGGDARRLAPLAHAALLAKDSALAVALARSLEVDLPLGTLAAAAFAGACAAGEAVHDDAVLFDLAREASRR